MRFPVTFKMFRMSHLVTIIDCCILGREMIHRIPYPVPIWSWARVFYPPKIPSHPADTQWWVVTRGLHHVTSFPIFFGGQQLRNAMGSQVNHVPSLKMGIFEACYYVSLPAPLKGCLTWFRYRVSINHPLG